MSEPKRTPKELAAHFIGGLRRLRHDRGKIAALRRGLIDNPRLHVDAYPVVAGLGGDIGNPIFTAIAALYATHPEEATCRNFGETCRRIAMAHSGAIEESTEGRFRRLLASESTDDVTSQIRSWIRLAASKGVAVNYESLFADLWNWRFYAEDIRVQWARAFWQAGEVEEQTSQRTTTSSTVTSL
jgi:CRISPR type I-E-associated protein CasB/Cse2